MFHHNSLQCRWGEEGRRRGVRVLLVVASWQSGLSPRLSDSLNCGSPWWWLQMPPSWCWAGMPSWQSRHHLPYHLFIFMLQGCPCLSPSIASLSPSILDGAPVPLGLPAPLLHSLQDLSFYSCTKPKWVLPDGPHHCCGPQIDMLGALTTMHSHGPSSTLGPTSLTHYLPASLLPPVHRSTPHCPFLEDSTTTNTVWSQ